MCPSLFKDIPVSTSALLFYIFFGSAALAYMVYGKSQRNAVALLAGIGLAVIPYFGLELWLMVLLSLVMMALPFFLRI